MKAKSRFSPDEAKLTDKEIKIKERSKKLIEWLEKQNPDLPLVINRGVSIPNFEKAVRVHKNALESCRVMSPAWRAYANNLAAMKAAIDRENEKQKTEQNAPRDTDSNNEKTAPVQDLPKGNRKRK